MKIPWRIARSSHLLGAAGLALLLLGCADQQPAAPDRPQLKLPPTSGPVTVSSEITLADGRTITEVQKLRVAVKGGLAYSMVITDSSAVASGYTQPLTPVVAASTGTIAGNYNETIVDQSSGAPKLYRIVASGPMIENYPVTEAYAYNSSNRKVAEIHFLWAPVPGGYALLKQKQISYSSTGAVTATILSTVTSPATYAMGESQSISAKLGSLLTDLSCVFSPKVAYAQGKKLDPIKGPIGGEPITPHLIGADCIGEGGILAFNTGIIAFESMGGVLMAFEIPIYIGSWVTWTHSLYHFLHCMRHPPRCRGARCTGGGGGGGGGGGW